MRPHVIYVIVGECGQYDHSQWNVCWRMTEAEAQMVVDELNEAARGVGDCKAAEGLRLTGADPWFKTDYGDTHYHYEPLADDAQAFEAERKLAKESR